MEAQFDCQRKEVKPIRSEKINHPLTSWYSWNISHTIHHFADGSTQEDIINAYNRGYHKETHIKYKNPSGEIIKS